MIQFPKTDLHGVLRQRVNDYFNLSDISKYGGKTIVIKSLVLLALLFIPYVILLTYNHSAPSMLLLTATMGLAIAGLGMGVMHDCIHGSFSSSPKLNKWWGTIIYVLITGGNPICWRLQHNVLHHRFTNIHDVDEDLNPYGFMRFCPHDKQKSIFRFQHLYAIFLYALTTLIWVLHKEFAQLKRYFSMGLIKSKSQYRKELIFLIISKAIYFKMSSLTPPFKCFDVFQKNAELKDETYFDKLKSILIILSLGVRFFLTPSGKTPMDKKLFLKLSV